MIKLEIEHIRETFHQMTRRLGLLDKNCCKVGDSYLSVTQSHILYEINKRREPSMQDIADTLGIDITTFSRQIQTLVKLGLVVKTEHFEDRRIYVLSLSEEGAGVVRLISEHMNTYFQELFSNMTDFERDTVIKSIQLLNQCLAKSGVCCSPLR